LRRQTLEPGLEEIRRRDRAVFGLELLRPARVLVWLGLIGVGLGFLRGGLAVPWPFWPFLGLVVAGTVWSAYRASVPKRFRHTRMRLHWEVAQDRHARFTSALKSLAKSRVARLEELPSTIDATLQTLYRALRRADIVAHEVAASEGWLLGQPKPATKVSPDQQAQELYRLADRNIAEYRQHFQAVMASVERTEAQAAVFTTTLDTLRMKLLGYRLVGRETEAPTQEFLAALTEARMQLDAIDKALDEIELTPFPTTVVTIPEREEPSVEDRA
jgi:hypothetical protein